MVRNNSTPKIVHSRKYLYLLFPLLLSGCYNLQRFENFGDQPSLTPVKDPTKIDHYHPVTTPTPEPQEYEHRTNSLWRTGARGFFKDQRAKRKGDILMVDVKITGNKGNIESNTQREKKSADENLSMGSFLGYETHLDKILPQAVNPGSLVRASNRPKFESEAKTERADNIDLKVAAIIIQILPNGNYVIYGRQEVRVNFEVRELVITGIVRPTDIKSTNIVDFNTIADGRISYGGRGHGMDFQQPGVVSQALANLAPF